MMTDLQRYMFDVQGFVVLRDVLDGAAVAELRERMTAHIEGAEPDDPTIARVGDGSIRTVEFLHRDAAFRRLLDHPAVVGTLEELLSPGFRIDHYYGMQHPKGTGRLPLHGGGHRRGSEFYVFRDGQIFTGMAVASWALTDAPSEGGGFVCIPGSHKANYDLSRLEAFQDAARAQEIVAFDDPGIVRRVDVRAGDVLIFTEALCHGAEPWPLDEPRLALLYKYSPAAISWRRPQPLDERTAAVLTDAQRRLFEPPYETPLERRFRVTGETG